MSSLLLQAASPFISKGIKITWENREYLNLLRKTKFGKFKNENIRFSISGLYKIQIPGTNDYLLVLNRKIPNQLQPVGGAYKRLGDDSLFNGWNYKPDNHNNGLGVDDDSEEDLRFMVKGKYCIDVMNWFEENHERESNPRREFEEELIAPGILDSEIFRNIQDKHIRRFSKNLNWSPHFSCYEVLIFDVFELIPNQDQKKALIQLAQKGSNLEKGYAIVSCDDIEREKYMRSGKEIARIGQHTKLIINQEF